MEKSFNFENFIINHFKISIAFFALGLIFGIIYSINLLGFSIDSETLNPVNMRSIHISLMLYGFVPLMLSYLPFLLINKERKSLVWPLQKCNKNVSYCDSYFDNFFIQ